MFWEIGLFALVTLVVTLIFALVQQKAGWSYEKITLPQLAPAVAVLVLFLIWRELPARLNFRFDGTVAIRSAMAFAIPLGLFGVAHLAGRLFGIEAKTPSNLTSLLPVMIAGMVIGALGEETGWRGFLQPFLEERFSLPVASILVGLIWGLWHVTHYKNGVLFMVGFLLLTCSASLIVAWLLRGTDYNLILASLFHLSINIGFLAFFSNSTDSRFMLLNGVVWLIPAIVIVLFSPAFGGELSF
jgi:membrane protease YdiL (CAAX protease family)